MTQIKRVEGIGEGYALKLRAVGIRSTEALLARGGSDTGRRQLAEITGISEKLLLEWVNHVDLFRIVGIGEEYSDLLEEAGVDTVVELATRNPANLYQKLVETNAARKLVRHMPSARQVEGWIAQAKELPRKVTY